MIKGVDALTEISPFEYKHQINIKIKIKNQYKQFRRKLSVETKIMQMRMYQFKLTKNLFLSHRCQHVSSLARWNRLYIDTKILLNQIAYRVIFSI